MTVTSNTPTGRFFYCANCGTRFSESGTFSQQACDCRPCTVRMSPDICSDCGKELEPGTIHIGCGQEEEEMSLRETIMVRVDDLVINFVYYDRKEDDELSAADLESAISCGQVTVDEIVERFRVQLREAYGTT